MTSRDFCYWLQGLFELGNPAQLDAAQTASVKAHLAMAFIHEIDPSAEPSEHREVLDEIHKAAQPNNPPKIGGTGPGGAVYRC